LPFCRFAVLPAPAVLHVLRQVRALQQELEAAQVAQ